MSSLQINHIRLKGNQFFDGVKITEFQELKELYKSLSIDYPKFHKMDKLSQMAMIMTHSLSLLEPLEKDTLLLFANSISSFNTDVKHQQSIQPEAYFPSPANFVYTLPNISLGEIAIKYQLKNENLFLVCNQFSSTLFTKHTSIYFNEGAETALCLWIDDHDNDLDGFAFLLKKNDLTKYSIAEIESKLNELYTNG